MSIDTCLGIVIKIKVFTVRTQGIKYPWQDKFGDYYLTLPERPLRDLVCSYVLLCRS